jgi:hypothetical protein
MKVRAAVKTLFAALGLLLYGCHLGAQTDTLPAVTTSGNIDLVSRYVWRGQDLGRLPSIQPGLSASWKGFTIGSWGTYSFTGAGQQETDFYLSKTFGFVTLSIWDYWAFENATANDFFNYRDKTTAHLAEVQVQLSGGKTLPFNLLASYFFYGADPSRSIYLELQYVHSFKVADLVVFTGYQARGTFYAAHPSFVNLGCAVKRSIAVSDRLSLPMSLSFILNPEAKSAWLVAGITI